MIENVNIINKDFESLVSICEEKMALYKNNIDWKVPVTKNINEKSPHIKFIDSILQYSSSLEILKKIEEIKMSNDISKIMGLSTEFQKNHEFKSLLKYIISLKNYQEFDFKYTNRI